MGVGEPLPLKFNPQVVKDSTRRASEMTYFDCDKVRFVNGFPRSIGGWEKISDDAVIGVPRSLFGWSDIAGNNLMSVGTSQKYYMEEGGSFEDITPVRATETGVSLTTVAGSHGVTVNDAGHGAIAGDYVILDASVGVGGITVLAGEYAIISVTSSSAYIIRHTSAALSDDTKGSIGVTYLISGGLDTVVLGGGWGAGTWGRETWGSGVDATIVGSQLRVWTQDNFGEDLVFAPRGGVIYYKDVSSGAGRAVAISSLGSANEVPTWVDQVLVAADERTVFAFGCNPIGSSSPDPLMVRWADRESLVEWEPGATNSAGGIRLSLGSKHMIAVKIRQGIATFTNRALYLIQFLGTQGYGQRLIADNTIILGPKAATVLNGIVYWMATRGIFMFNGTTSPLPSPMVQFMYDNMNSVQSWKCHIGVNAEFNELKFFYCSKDSDEIDSYVIYNVIDQNWCPGTMERTCWLESGTFQKPRAADPDGYVYEHETGLNDGSTNPPSPLNSFVETNIFALGNAKYQHRIRAMWPDINFQGSLAATPEVTVSMRLQNRQGSTDALAALGDVVNTVSVPVEEFTDKIDVKKRARFMSLRIDCAATDTAWQLGVPHLDLVQDGQR